MTESVLCYIGLGSNLDQPVQHVQCALEELALLPNTVLLQHSSLYSSTPVGPQDQPDFINAVAALSTRLSPDALLDELQALEQAHQRVRERHWGPRTLDLDLLLYGNEVIDTDRLKVPHPYMTERNFVLYPLAEIAPMCEIPGADTLTTLLSGCTLGSLTKLQV
ncbi:2-amino-4-hydroxy-6-hydroxymethyldihydropteridine diphosphokinase [Neptuniibacter sp. CAU 1671]|uniref:2-amino-4-hydroxy-6- hydroxymethyldihydropteridine diphosphokinase n=1 Tax=Neptuniibacter sp. CAU 1671 TaxID=3032593 RepID=UPI0023DC22FE|nr:2-amino-4-hydroxy-6-hydroxymethyldihydropteridine diphosphokinase [Neptuniibacter sp. CAU 1671]MDF2182304.1 2-amino-4-hydroxy-6-hydroxymethyldihydropteridine diphosphokinase [Neptuniibacter sp. CAU 1671]